MDSACSFCQIVDGQRESQVVFADPLTLAFLDQRPLFFGHCLLIPRKHYETLPDLPPSLIGPLFANTQLLSRAVQQAMGAEGILLLINNRVSQSVPHLHVHIVPRQHGDGLRGFLWPRTRYDGEAHMAQVGDQIRRVLAALQSAGSPANAEQL
jgi:histidine triad (HIT) family protein